ncbi:MAG: hypothetical protein ACTSYF_16580 [Promethearchaeota archaeon]
MKSNDVWDFKLNDKHFLLKILDCKDLSTRIEEDRSFLELARDFHKLFNVHVIYIRADRILSEDIVLIAIHHFIKDYFQRKIKLTKYFALDFLMHLYFTTQVNFIQENIIPSGINQSKQPLNDIVLLLVFEDGSVNLFQEFMRNFSSTFNFHLRPKRGSAENQDYQVIEFFHKILFKRKVNEGILIDTNQLKSLIVSSIAHFSLKLQIKS